MALWFRVVGTVGRAVATASLALLVVFAMNGGTAFAKGGKKSGKSDTKSGAICELDADDDDDDKSDDKSAPKVPKRFLIHGACTEFSAEANIIGQNVLKRNGSILPLLTRRGLVSGPDLFVATMDFSPRIETTRKTAWGNLNTVFELKALRDTTGNSGLINMSEGYVAWAGWTVGYTDSLMNFWTGDDFQVTSNAPARSIGLVAHEFKVTEDLKISLGSETGVPTSSGTDVRFVPVTFLDPVISARLLYEKDDFSIHLSGMTHELKAGGNDPLLARLGITGEATARGWAATTGITVPVPATHEDDKFTVQATYALNSSPYLGTQADLSTLAAFAPPGTQTRGWSALTAYHHVWADDWELNLFASRIQLDIELPLGRPRIDVVRYAANVKWEAVPGFTVGTELGYIDAKVDPNGTLGLLSSSSGSGLIGYLFATWTF